MSSSTLNFSASLPPFTQTSGYNTNFSNTNLTATGNVSVANATNNATGANTTTITGSINSNGLNYTENSASINGNVLTVNYTSGNAAGSAQDSDVSSALLNTNINGNGVAFSPQSSTTNGTSVTTSYGTKANANFGLSIPNAALSTGNSDDGENIVLKSLSVVGNSLTATFTLTGNIPNNTLLAPSSPPPVSTISVISPSSVNSNTHNGATFSSAGIMTIGDLLAATTGIGANGSLTSALQGPGQGLSTGIPASNSVLASVLNPNINLSPDASLQVTDFVNTGSSTFTPTSTSSSNNSGSNSGAFTPSNNTGNTSSNQNDSGGNSTPTAIYNAVSNASASTIRGTGVNTVA